ncbi:hypothetical protein M3Y97_01070100 [Aphelenchoides bicaudatus]|nr:hypothetical protein M3Y97_01070100 [Aphelenchoides bicaudatus]
MKATQIVLICIAGLFVTSSAATDYKGSCLTKFVDLISSFFTRDQISQLADTAMDEIIDQSPASDIIGAMINKAVGILNSGQYSQFSSLMLKAYGTIWKL